MRTDMCRRGVDGLRVWHLMVLLVLISMSMWGGAITRAWAQTPVPATLVQAATPMLPYMDWLIDPSGSLTVEDMAAPAQQAAFRPLNIEKIPRESGTVWLRFTLAPRVVDSRPSTYLLDMGEGVPGTPTLYLPKHNVLNNTTTWQDFTPSQRSIFLMPDAQTSPVTAYIKMAGMPGLWFAPMLRTPHNAATALERLLRPAVIVVLGVVMLLCLLRGLAERGEWRFWTSLYTGAALLHSVWGVPRLLQGAVPMDEIAAVLAPGVALMLLPHVGRHLMRTREKARVIDVQYILLALPGAALALIPLLPGFSWTIRYLDLWPLGTLLLVPTTLGAWMMGLAGARRFLLGCLLPPLATALGLMGIGSSFPAPLLATAPLWGVALSALIIAGTAATYDPAESEAALLKDDPLHDPTLRIVTPEELAQEAGTPLPEPTTWEKDVPARLPSDSVALAWEEKLRSPMDTMLREGVALGSCSLPPVARQHAQNLQDTVRSMLTLLSQPLGGGEPSNGSEGTENAYFDLQQLLRDAHDSVATSAENKNIALSWFMPPHLPNRFVGDGQRLGVCIRLLLESAVRATSRGGVQLAVRRVPESVDAGHLLFSVTDTGAGMPPHDRSSVAVARAWELAAVHRGFFGVECSPHGTSVSFSVRLLAASAVTTADNESEIAMTPRAMPEPDFVPPHDVNADTVWQPKKEADVAAVAATGLTLPVAMVAAEGDTDLSSPITVAVDGRNADKAMAKAPTRAALPRIIIADDSLSNRQLLAFFLEGLPYSTVEARSPDEAADLYTASPAALIIFDGDMPEEDTLNTVTRIRAFEAEYSLPQALVLALTTDDSRWEVLHSGGFTHALVKPVSRTGLRRTVAELLPEGTVVVPPLSMAFSDVSNPLHMGEAGTGGMGTDSASIPFGMSETERVLQEEAATKSAWTDDGHAVSTPVAVQPEDEIFDTGAPLQASAPLCMTPESKGPEPAKNTPIGGGMPVPMMENLLTAAAQAQGVPDRKVIKQVMPDVAPVAFVDSGEDALAPPAVDPEEGSELVTMGEFGITGVTDGLGESGESGSTDDSGESGPTGTSGTQVAQVADSARPDAEQKNVGMGSAAPDIADSSVEEVYPYHPHTPASTIEAGAGHSSTSTLASLDSPVPSSVADTGASVKSDPPPLIHAFSNTPTTGQAPTENAEWVGEPVPMGSNTPSQATAATARASVSAIPEWMRNSVASRGEAASRAPSGATEWVGEPMPIFKAPVATDENLSPVQVTRNADGVFEADAATPPVVAVTGNDKGASRIGDLLTPYTVASLVIQDNTQDADDELPDAVLPPDVSRPHFIPLSFDAAPVAAPLAALVPPTVTPLVTPVVAKPVAEDREDASPAGNLPLGAELQEGSPPKVDRLSLIPTESTLMDFIISSPVEQETAQVVEQVQAPVAVKAAPAASVPPRVHVVSVASAPAAPVPKKITITAEAVQRPPKVATLVFKPTEAVIQESPRATATVLVPAPASATAAVISPVAPARATATVIPQAVSVRPAVSVKATAPAVSVAPTAVTVPVPPSASAVPVPPDSPIPIMLKEFDEAMAYARGGFARKNIQAVQDSAEYIASRSETCGLRVLARMARCVGEAAKAGDVEALNNLLPELETAVERNKIALMKK